MTDTLSALTVSTADQPPRAASSLVVVRDSAAGIETLLLLRTDRGDHNSGAWVFPGGVVDPLDRDWHRCTGLDDRSVSDRMNLEQGGLDYVIASIRECFEEAGVLYAEPRDGGSLSGAASTSLQSWRVPLHRGERTMGELCADHDLRLVAERLAYFSHWLTPAGRPKRFDTRFFVAEMPANQAVSHDGVEMIAHQWLRPSDALARADSLRLMTPTRALLKTLGDFGTVDALMRWAREPREVTRILPRLGRGKNGAQPVTPGEHAYAEIGRLDPEGRGHASYDIQTDVPVRLSSRVIRVTANNGSVMTGPGTNTYLIDGGGDGGWSVIDPGPLDADHVRAILAAAPGPIRSIFVTHTHVDHSPATVMLKAATGALVHGRVATYPDRQDATFTTDRVLNDGETIALGPDATLRVVHTPGHASNHLCYLLEEERTLFTGDHVMQGSTVVINPPDGDMAAYIASLRSLAKEPGAKLEWLAPGHGFLIEKPVDAFERIVRHRLKRETKLIDALTELIATEGAVSEPSLLKRVYEDVPERMHPVAMRSLLAHLFKLRDEGVVRNDGHGWLLIG